MKDSAMVESIPLQVETSYKEHAIDRLTRKASQLSALLSVTVCEDFSTYNEEIKSNYLWACSELATEVSETAKKIEAVINRANND